jgi:hypothetical protein
VSIRSGATPQCATPQQKTDRSALRNRRSIVGRSRRIGTKSGPLRRLIKSPAVKYIDRRTLRINRNGPDGADPASSQSADRDFQRAMQRAIARGLENPPMTGVFKDNRPLNPPRLFEPVPYSSGCTSPALECAELVSLTDLPLAIERGEPSD